MDGLRVLDFCRLGFGSQATLILGCLGADVIRVESTTRPDPIRVMPPFIPEPGEQGEGFGGATLANANKVRSLNRGGIFYKYNTGGKRSIAVDARHPEGLSVLERLVAVSDVVTESFAAGTLARWGLGYERLRELRPDVIYVSMCGYGHTGPDSSFVTMGPTAQALTGLTHMVGLPGREPAGWSFSYLDHVGGYLGAVAVLSRRWPTGGRPARASTSTCPSSSRPPRWPGRSCSTGPSTAARPGAPDFPHRQPTRRRPPGCLPRRRRGRRR